MEMMLINSELHPGFYPFLELDLKLLTARKSNSYRLVISASKSSKTVKPRSLHALQCIKPALTASFFKKQYLWTYEFKFVVAIFPGNYFSSFTRLLVLYLLSHILVCLLFFLFTLCLFVRKAIFSLQNLCYIYHSQRNKGAKKSQVSITNAGMILNNDTRESYHLPTHHSNKVSLVCIQFTYVLSVL